MILEGTNLETGKTFKAVVDDLNQDFFDSMLNVTMSENEIQKAISNLDVSADVKSLLSQFAKVTLKAGEVLLKIGRRIIEFIFILMRENKSATFGMIFGAVVGLLISSIPVLGMILGPIFAPIAIALGLVLGLNEDIKDRELERKIAEVNAKFEPLKKVKS